MGSGSTKVRKIKPTEGEANEVADDPPKYTVVSRLFGSARPQRGTIIGGTWASISNGKARKGSSNNKNLVPPEGKKKPDIYERVCETQQGEIADDVVLEAYSPSRAIVGNDPNNNENGNNSKGMKDTATKTPIPKPRGSSLAKISRVKILHRRNADIGVSVECFAPKEDSHAQFTTLSTVPGIAGGCHNSCHPAVDAMRVPLPKPRFSLLPHRKARQGVDEIRDIQFVNRRRKFNDHATQSYVGNGEPSSHLLEMDSLEEDILLQQIIEDSSRPDDNRLSFSDVFAYDDDEIELMEKILNACI